MNNPISITYKQVEDQAIKRHDLRPNEEPMVLFHEVLKDMCPEHDSKDALWLTCENNLISQLEKKVRGRVANEDEFKRIGQMDLFGNMIPEHKVPKIMMERSCAEVSEWMEQRAKIERENLEELLIAVKKQQSKSAKFDQWYNAVQLVKSTIEKIGLDPERISYEEAINKAQTHQHGDESVPGKKAKQSVCPVRIDD